ncbi:hypothetical protein MICA_869 [Micavibrio aeruginosavorus ARL-13]|uniref:Uncharacterized protein n=1 Tax=Micavibrio aeruginosavorus (strain ARL-13) TaxID=856793 RepID=G2KRF5_MICAA|nr:hypothetical protein MICA_869 [Micavibrio aeruginosavorus ARL-13]
MPEYKQKIFSHSPSEPSVTPENPEGFIRGFIRDVYRLTQSNNHGKNPG